MTPTQTSLERSIHGGLSHLAALEAESIFIMREVAAEFERPVAAVLGRQGLHRPAAPRREGIPTGALPLPAHARRHRPQLPRGPRLPRPARGRAGRAAHRRQRPGVASTRVASARSRATPRATGCRPMTLLDAIQEHQFDAVFGGAGATRRRRAPRSASSRSATSSGSGSRARSGPSCGASTTAASGRASTCASSPSPTGRRWTCGSTSSGGARGPVDLLRPRARRLPARRHVALDRPVPAPAGRRADRAG